MLTAAVRDLHRCYPGEFRTATRTSCAELWLNNPYISNIEGDAREIQCEYPLINGANQLPYHFIHGFIAHLNGLLGLSIYPTQFRGDIYLSDQEKLSAHDFANRMEKKSYWLIAAGGKLDYTIKWWSTDRYQSVVNALSKRISFVQIGAYGHHHPPLEGVIDLRGRTTLRQLIRLVHCADGCLTPVSLLMHLAPAIEPGPERITRRSCVVIAGGREPPHWEAYPTHAFLHTVGMLSCCSTGGCWKSRTIAIGDGYENDATDKLCSHVTNNLPRCMDMITPEEVCRAIERIQDVADAERRLSER
jgi:ADP-heptose:LPS heptosyltransferase